MYFNSVFAVMIVVVVAHGLPGSQVAADEPRDSLYVELEEGPVLLPGYGDRVGFTGVIAGTRAGASGLQVTDGLLLYVHRQVHNSKGDEIRREKIIIVYGPTSEGDIIPYAGAIYRVGTISSVPSVRFKLTDRSDLPKGMEHPADSYALPVGAMAKFGELRLYVLEAKVDTRAGKSVVTASIQLAEHLDREKPKDVDVGDPITIGKNSYKVISILPSDPDRQIIGWIVLEPVVEE